MLSGKKQSGKDTAAKYLIGNFNFYRIGLADELKKDCAKILYSCFAINVSSQSFESEVLKSQIIDIEHNTKKCTYRKFLQYYGTEFIRNLFDDSYWAKIVCEKIRIYRNEDNFVIPDFRFQNEYDTIYNEFKDKYQIIPVLIQRDVKTDQDSSHSSENSLEEFLFDHVIDNNGTIKELHEKIDNIMRG